MNKWEKLLGRCIWYIFLLCATGVLVYFIWGEIHYPRETDERDQNWRKYNLGWSRIYADGTKKDVDVPGKYATDEDGIIEIAAQLPDAVDDDDWICFKTSKQDVEISVGNEVRKRYSTKDTRPFGNFSVSQYIFVSLQSTDAGSGVVYKARGDDSERAGIINDIYYGDRFAIWLHLVISDGIGTIITLFMILVGVLSIIIITFVNLKYKKNINLQYLCWGIVLLALWLICQSNIRQLIFPNISVANSMTYFTILLAPIPFLIYVDSRQKHRYHKMHLFATVMALANFAACTCAQIFFNVDFMDMFRSLFMGIGTAFIIILVSFMIDASKGKIGGYKLVAIGFTVAIVASCIQMANFYFVEISNTGTPLAVGMLVMLLMAVIEAVEDLLELEYQKQQAVMESAAKARFLAGISHEIRTPINAVIGMDEMILRESEEEHTKEYAADILKAGKNLLALINDVLDVSKIESGRMEIVETDYELYGLIDSCFNMIALNAREKGLSVEVINDRNCPYKLRGDEVRVRQIIVNLLTNAVKYTKSGKIVLEIGYEKTDGHRIWLKIKVSDTGIGIKQENIKHLFDTFARIDIGKNHSIEGTGLGLSIVKQLVDLMGGSISVDSEYGKGSVFTALIPQQIVSERAVGEYRTESRSDKAYEVKQTYTAPSARILVVDDVPMNIKVITGLLKDTHIVIDEADSGEQCLRKVKMYRYDCIFLDHMMPEMDGIETLVRMKAMKDGINADTPVIVLTANALLGAKEEYMAAGFSDYLSKPVRRQDLDRMLLKYINKDKIN